MNKSEFIESYCNRGKVSWDWLKQYRVALPCECDEDICDGWAMIPNDKDAIDGHLFFHGPK